MSYHARAPELYDKNIQFRVATDPHEREAADRLVFETYVEEGFWGDAPTKFQAEMESISSHRTVFVAVKENVVIGTLSLVCDSQQGLPADHFQPEMMAELRDSSEVIGQAGLLAMDRSCNRRASLVLFLFKYLYQYSFYYAGVDRFVALSSPKHARFYQSVMCFEKVGQSKHYPYAKATGQLLTLHLIEAHKLFRERFGDGPDLFYRFVLVDEHPNLIFPGDARRSRHFDWAGHASLLEQKAVKRARPDLEGADGRSRGMAICP